MKKEKEQGEVIIAPRYVELQSPIIFLAGPIRGAADWQGQATEYIKRKKPQLNIASPRRLLITQDDFPEPMFVEQINWEHYHLRMAAESGVILFWLAKELDHRCDRSYAQTTRFELGEAAAIHRFTGAKVVVGIENGFTGGKYIRKTLAGKYPGIPVCSSLEETCDMAIKLYRRPR
ncbi:MAG: hypothetical protein HYW69_02240 [Candidatus Nealsonbacteria bacterium]|nr:hypothetical protein [Candidatus Nealsonbacteria bacterium]